jgi:transposase-like protein
MAHSPETKAQVRASYIYERLSIEDAATKHGVSKSAAQAWKRIACSEGDDWDKARAAHSLSKGGIESVNAVVLEDFMLQFKATIEAVKDGDYDAMQKTNALAKLADSYSKITNSVAKTSPTISKLAIAMQVINLLADFIKEKYPDQLPVFVEMLQQFGQEICKEFG